MKTYAVTIRADVTKTYFIEAESEDDAINDAHETFSLLNDIDGETVDIETMADDPLLVGPKNEPGES